MIVILTCGELASCFIHAQWQNLVTTSQCFAWLVIATTNVLLGLWSQPKILKHLRHIRYLWSQHPISLLLRHDWQLASCTIITACQLSIMSEEETTPSCWRQREIDWGHFFSASRGDHLFHTLCISHWAQTTQFYNVAVNFDGFLHFHNFLTWTSTSLALQN